MNDYNKAPLITKRALTPDKAIYFIPFSIGISTALLFAMLLLRPLWIRTSESYATLVKYRTKDQQLVYLESQHKIISDNLEKALLQRDGLINLITGESDLKTILSQLNILSNQNNLKIVGLLPKETERVVPLGLGSEANLPIGDPFLVENVVKFPYEVDLEGYFPDVLQFLRDLEDLETIVIISDINIEQLKQYSALTTQGKANPIKVRLNISAYGKNK